MRKALYNQMLALARTGSGPFCTMMAEVQEQFNKAVEATNDPVLLVKLATASFQMLAEKLNKNGYTVVQEPGFENGIWVKIFKDTDQLHAQGYSNTFDDALVHAFLGAEREEHARKVIAEELAERKLAVERVVLQKMETRFIECGNNKAGLQEALKLIGVA